VVLSEIIRVEAPKSPVKRGRRGSLIGVLSARWPRAPARRNIISALCREGSRRIIKREMKIRRKGMSRVMGVVIEGRMRMKRGVKIRIIGRASREPLSVRRTASCPRPFCRRECPGRIERKESSSGAPR